MSRKLEELGFPMAVGIGAAQALALIPGVSRSGVSISAGLFAGLTREGAARFSFLMATPITALAVAYETVKLVRGDVAGVELAPLIAGTSRRSSRACSPSRCSCGSCGPTRTGSSSPTGSWWPRS